MAALAGGLAAPSTGAKADPEAFAQILAQAIGDAAAGAVGAPGQALDSLIRLLTSEQSGSGSEAQIDLGAAAPLLELIRAYLPALASAAEQTVAPPSAAPLGPPERPAETAAAWADLRAILATLSVQSPGLGTPATNGSIESPRGQVAEWNGAWPRPLPFTPAAAFGAVAGVAPASPHAQGATAPGATALLGSDFAVMDTPEGQSLAQVPNAANPILESFKGAQSMTKGQQSAEMAAKPEEAVAALPTGASAIEATPTGSFDPKPIQGKAASSDIGPRTWSVEGAGTKPDTAVTSDVAKPTVVLPQPASLDPAFSYHSGLGAEANVTDRVGAGQAIAQTASTQSGERSVLDQLPPQVRTQEPVSTQIVRSAQLTLERGGGTARIQLEPPELGRLDLNIKVGHDGIVTMHIVSQSHETRALVQSQIADLQAGLQDRGFEVGDLNVSVRDERQAAGGREQEPAADSFRDGPLTNSINAEVDAKPPVPWRGIYHGRIDYAA